MVGYQRGGAATAMPVADQKIGIPTHTSSPDDQPQVYTRHSPQRSPPLTSSSQHSRSRTASSLLYLRNLPRPPRTLNYEASRLPGLINNLFVPQPSPPTPPPPPQPLRRTATTSLCDVRGPLAPPPAPHGARHPPGHRARPHLMLH